MLRSATVFEDIVKMICTTNCSWSLTKIIINNLALREPEIITQAAEIFGNQFVVVSIDAKKRHKRYEVFSDNGQKPTGLEVASFAKKAEQLGAGEIFLNSIDQDGVMKGYDLELIKKVASAVSLPVIACGGAGKVQDIIDAVKIGGANAVSLASMFHYSGHTANSIKERMRNAKIPVRII